MNQEITLTNTQKVLARLNPTVNGSPVTLDSPANVAVAFGDATVVPNENGDPLSFWLVSGSGNADSGFTFNGSSNGTAFAQDTVTMHIGGGGGGGTGFNITLDAPIEKTGNPGSGVVRSSFLNRGNNPNPGSFGNPGGRRTY